MLLVLGVYAVPVRFAVLLISLGGGAVEVRLPG